MGTTGRQVSDSASICKVCFWPEAAIPERRDQAGRRRSMGIAADSLAGRDK